MSKFLVFVLLAIFSHFFVQVPFFALLLLTVICYLVFFLVSPKKAVLIFLFFLISQGVLTYFTRMPIVANLDELGIFCITFLLLARKLYKREKILTGGIEIPLLFLTILGFLSNIINRIVPWPVAVGGYILFIKGFLLFYILLNLGINTEDLKKFKPMFYLLGVFTFLYGVLGLIWPKFFLIPLGIMPDTRFGFPTMQSFMGHPGAFAALMGILYCFSFTDALYKKRPIYILLTLIFFLAVILSFRRTTLAGIILASFV
ncbi:MAG: hypothetical protein N2606_02590, partial [Candidatus Omnitrophica bacterium]|nr:hypothetical protein [Candidatus Omnitrophota bacterium]